MRNMDFGDWLVLSLFVVMTFLVVIISKSGWDQHRATVKLENQEHRIRVYRDSPSVQILTDTKTGWEYLLVDEKSMVRLEPGKELEKP